MLSNNTMPRARKSATTSCTPCRFLAFQSSVILELSARMGLVKSRSTAAATVIQEARPWIGWSWRSLMWFLMEKGRQPTESRPGQLRPKRCETCYKSFSKFSLTAVSAECQICRRTMCAKGNVVKKMKVDVSETGAVKQCAIRFCLNCLMEANEQSVWAMALSGVETASETSSASGSASSGAFHVAIIDDRELGRQLIKRWLRTARAIPDCRACRVSSLELSDAST
jgi:hypothetical protein